MNFILDIEVKVWMTIKRYPQDHRFTLISTTGHTCKRSSYSAIGTWYESCNLIPGDYYLSCIDTFGDGWHGGYITILDVKYCQGLTSGKLATAGPINITYDSGPGVYGMYMY